MKKIVALILLTVLTQPLVFAQKQRSLSDEQRIIHVLNRLGFGARPGDVERVKAMGLENYINQQLHPEKIADAVAENKLHELSVLNMTTAELYEKYPQPGQLLRQLQARGMAPEEMSDQAKNNQNTPPANPLDNEKNRKIIEEYYRDNGLQRPQRIIAELQASNFACGLQRATASGGDGRLSDQPLQYLRQQRRRSLATARLRSRHDSSQRAR